MRDQGTSAPAHSQHTASTSPQWGRFNAILVALVLAAILAVTALNILVDPWGIFGVLDMRDGHSLNQRVAKLRYLVNHAGLHDAFLVGSSRMGLFDIADAQAQWPEHSWYNLGVFSADAEDNLSMLRSMDAEGVKIRKVIIGIDLYPFFASHHKDPLAHRLPPMASGESAFDFWSRYLFAQSALPATLKIVQQFQETPDIVFDIEGSGSFRLPMWDKEREEDLEGFVDRQVRKEATAEIKSPLREVEFEKLEELVAWLDGRGIERVMFIHPHHHLSAPMRVERSVRDGIVERVMEITGPIRNFLDEDWGWKDDLFYDDKHYIPALARQIIAKLRSEQTPGGRLTCSRDRRKERH